MNSVITTKETAADTATTLLMTPWGLPATLDSVHEGFAKTPVDFVDGVIVTPFTTLYRLLMDGEAQSCPDLANRLLKVGYGKVILDVNEAEFGRCTKA